MRSSRGWNAKAQENSQFGSIRLIYFLPQFCGNPGGSLLSQDVAVDMSALDDGPRHRHGMQDMQLVQQDDTYIKEREETMHSIESTIVELSGIFQQLAHMVKEQEEQVQRYARRKHGCFK